MLTIRHLIIISVIAITACSTRGGIYKEGDVRDGEFAADKTILTVIGIIGSALLIGNSSNGDKNYNIPYEYDSYDTTSRENNSNSIFLEKIIDDDPKLESINLFESKEKKPIELATQSDGKTCRSSTECASNESCRSKKGGGSVCKKIN